MFAIFPSFLVWSRRCLLFMYQNIYRCHCVPFVTESHLWLQLLYILCLFSGTSVICVAFEDLDPDPFWPVLLSYISRRWLAMVAEVVLEFFLWFLARGVKNTQEKQKPKQTAPDFLAVHFHSIYIYAVKKFWIQKQCHQTVGIHDRKQCKNPNESGIAENWLI